jgi:hypothetical protein
MEADIKLWATLFSAFFTWSRSSSRRMRAALDSGVDVCGESENFHDVTEHVCDLPKVKVWYALRGNKVIFFFKNLG